jgi:trk system potassium uptake protein TrkH
MLIRIGREDLRVVLKDVGIVLEYSALTFIAPLLIGIAYLEPIENIAIYFFCGVFAFLAGLAIKKLFGSEQHTALKHAFLTASIIWILYCAIAALPFNLIANMPLLDSFFEAMSALTTTGLSVMKPVIDSAPNSLIFWRSVLSWIGGVGIVVLAMAGVLTTYSKASRLILAEGRDERLRPNLKNSIRHIWNIYIGLTILGVILLYLSGMGLFDSLNYSMSAISTTGMDTTSTGLAGMHNFAIDASLVFIMLLGAISFSAHYLVLKKRNWTVLLHDAEFKVLMLLGLLSGAIILPKMILFYGSNIIGIEEAFFHAFSALTCGGFAIVPIGDMRAWGDYIKLVLVSVMFIGGSAGSTAGGIKISRFIIFCKSIFWRVKESILPEKSFFSRKFENQELSQSDLKEVNQFILLYVLFIIAGCLVLTLAGNSLGNSLFEVVSAQSNAGLSAGIAQAGMPISVEVMLILNMWIGRLEIIPILSTIGFFLSMKGKR